VFDEGKGLSTAKQQYDPTSIINEVRGYVDSWRALPNPNQWQVTPETVHLLQHWRHHDFSSVRPFFCQIEAVETAIWLTEVAPNTRQGKRLLDHLAAANKDANPELMRLALKLATGAGKTTVMSMLIAWQTVNAFRHEGSKNFTRGFLICTPGLTIKDRLRVLQPNDPENYYSNREIVPASAVRPVCQACQQRGCSQAIPAASVQKPFRSPPSAPRLRWMRHRRRPWMAGHRHGVPALVFAPQRGAPLMFFNCTSKRLGSMTSLLFSTVGFAPVVAIKALASRRSSLLRPYWGVS
jgi:hypothetical protein